MNDVKVTIWERNIRHKVRFYLCYTYDGKRHRDLLPIPSISEKDRHGLIEGRALAGTFLIEKQQQLKAAMLGQPLQSDMYLTEWMRIVADRATARQREGVHRHTWGRTILLTAEIIEQWRGKVTVSRVNRQFCSDFALHLHTLPLAQSTQSKRWDCFAFAIKEAVKEGMLAVNPCDLLTRKEKPHAPASQRAYLTAEELHTLSETPCPSVSLRTLYLFSCFTGLRISDINNLQWSDINRSGNRWTITIRQQKTQEPLTLPLSATAQSLLPPPSEGAVFADRLTEQALNRQLKQWAAAAGINKKLTFHTARHTFATLCLSQGVDIYTTSKLLGHSSVATTQIYAKIVDEKKVAAVDALDGLI